MNNKTLHMVAFLLLVVGGINWLLVGLMDLNLVNKILGGMPTFERIIYILVGISAVYELLTHKGSCRHCAAPTNTPV
jgi:uncharacterized protein